MKLRSLNQVLIIVLILGRIRCQFYKFGTTGGCSVSSFHQIPLKCRFQGDAYSAAD